MRTAIAFAAFGTVSLMTIMPPATAGNPESIVVTNYDPSPTIWTRGSLALVMKKDGAVAVGLNFSMPNGRLESMTLHGSGWSLEVTKEVSSLTSPWPTRAQAYIQKIDVSGVHEFTFVLPFGDPRDDCQEMQLHVVDGRLTEHGVSAASKAQCEP